MARQIVGNQLRNSLCRGCSGESLYRFLSLGSSPLANAFLEEADLEAREPTYLLEVYLCQSCSLVQLIDVVPPEAMFEAYPYITSASQPLLAHFAELAGSINHSLNPPFESLIVDIGSNDGTLLANFREWGFRVLGIDPASNIIPLAQTAGVETINDFFTQKVARRIREEKGPSTVVVATNVLAHVNGVDDFLQGVKTLLSEDGMFVIEVPYLVDMLEKMEFDTIYHEHLSYFSLLPLIALLSMNSLSVFDVKRVPVHGGSLRIFAQHSRGLLSPSENVQALLDQERQLKLNTLNPYLEFAEGVTQIKEKMLALLKSLRVQGATIAGYGAPAKGNTLLNYCGVGTDLLDYITDTTPFKQYRYSPGTHIPIFPESYFRQNPPDYALLLAWNYSDEILEKEADFRRRGGKFILPIPSPVIV